MKNKKKTSGPVRSPANVAQQIVVKFVDHIPALNPKDVAGSIRRYGLGSWDTLEKSFPGIAIKPAFQKVWDVLDRHTQVAKARTPDYVPPNFKSYCVIDVIGDIDVQAVISEIQKWSTVEFAYVRPAKSPIFPSRPISRSIESTW